MLLRRASFVPFIGPVLLALACGSDPGASEDDEKELGGDPTAREQTCVDADGDGFGVDCAEGPDCDDTDDTLFEDCSACSRPDEGCPCVGGEQPVTCELDAAQVPEGSLLCKNGMRYCRDGAWTECMGIATFD